MVLHHFLYSLHRFPCVNSTIFLQHLWPWQTHLLPLTTYTQYWHKSHNLLITNTSIKTHRSVVIPEITYYINPQPATKHLSAYTSLTYHFCGRRITNHIILPEAFIFFVNIYQRGRKFKETFTQQWERSIVYSFCYWAFIGLIYNKKGFKSKKGLNGELVNLLKTSLQDILV